METWEDQLLFALDGKYRELKQDNHVDPFAVLVYDVVSKTVEAVDLADLPLKHPVGPGERWGYSDLGAVVNEKALLFRQSVIATEISDEDPDAKPTVGTVVLVVTESDAPYHWITVKSRILPG